jgi:hypothetical protein
VKVPSPWVDRRGTQLADRLRKTFTTEDTEENTDDTEDRLDRFVGLLVNSTPPSFERDDDELSWCVVEH